MEVGSGFQITFLLRPWRPVAHLRLLLPFGYRLSSGKVFLERYMPKLIYGTLLSKHSELVRVLEK